MENIFSAAELEAFFLSLQVSSLSLLLIFIPAILLAYILETYSFFGKGFLDFILHLPLVMPPVVIGYLLLIVFGKGGWIGSYLYELFGIEFTFGISGAVIACAVVSFPLLLGMAKTAFHSINYKLKEAAFSLGASPLRTYLSITLVRALPGILAGSCLAWGRSLGEFGATIMFVSNIAGSTRTLPLAIYTQMQIPGSASEASGGRLVILALVLASFCLGLSYYLQKKMTILKINYS